jgi:hypothetical protein
VGEARSSSSSNPGERTGGVEVAEGDEPLTRRIDDHSPLIVVV